MYDDEPKGFTESPSHNYDYLSSPIRPTTPSRSESTFTQSLEPTERNSANAEPYLIEHVM